MIATPGEGGDPSDRFPDEDLDLEPDADDEAGSDAAATSFEDAFQALEATVARLESGDLPLAELVGLFERGMALVDLCNARLDAAELRISQLVSGPDGRSVAVPFAGPLDQR